MRLEEDGFKCVSAGLDKKQIIGKNGLKIDVDVLISDLKANDLKGLVLAGGWAPDKLRRYDNVINLIKEINSQNKVIGIICHGGSLAVSADILKGKKATGSLGIKDDLVNAGATWVDEAAFSEGNLVWGRVVADIPDFCREMVKTLNK
jgi:protease I